MADAPVTLNLDSDIHYFTIADSATVNKGDIMVLSDPRTVAVHSAGDEQFIGIAVEDKVANDGQTKIGVRTRGIADFYVATVASAGQLLMLSTTANRLTRVEEGTLSGNRLRNIVGKALETSSNPETIAVLFSAV